MLFSIKWKTADRTEAGFPLNKRAKKAENTSDMTILLSDRIQILFRCIRYDQLIKKKFKQMKNTFPYRENKMNTCMTLIPWLLINIIADLVECQPKIIGGEKGELSTFPFAVLINNDNSMCTGSLISLEWVLSAAHCFEVTGYTEDYDVSNYISMYF